MVIARRLAAVGFSLSALLAAQSPPGTLLANGDFDASLGISGWTVDAATIDPSVTPTFLWEPVDSSPSHWCPASGFARFRIDSDLNSMSGEVISDCSPVGGLTTVRLGFSAAVGGNSTYSDGDLRLASYSDQNCDAGHLLETTSQSFFTNPDWVDRDLGEVILPATTGSIRLIFRVHTIFCTIGCYTNVVFDNILLAPPNLLFSDGFEGGAACRW